MTIFQFNFIAGLMFGIEFPPHEEDESFVVVIDLGIVRLTIVNHR